MNKNDIMLTFEEAQKKAKLLNYRNNYKMMRKTVDTIKSYAKTGTLNIIKQEIKSIKKSNISEREKYNNIKDIILKNFNNINLNIFIMHDIINACQDAINKIKSEEAETIKQRIILSAIIQETNELISSAKKELKDYKKFFTHYKNIFSR